MTCRLIFFIFTFLCFLTSGCQMFWESIGHVGEPCSTEATCRGDLVCESGICINPGGDEDDDAIVDTDEDGNVQAGEYEQITDPGLTWLPIPSGTYQQGCVPQDTICDISENPRHEVSVEAFKMTATEVTQEHYEAVMHDNPSYSSYFENCPTCPVEKISWIEAKTFCERVGGRLPSEAEWEYAARAGTDMIWICGDNSSCLDEIAWYNGNSDNREHLVGGKDPNTFDLYDMSGNVWEWVEDCYHSDYTGHPGTGDVWTGGDCEYRVLRGGSWYGSNIGSLRPSYRYGYSPKDAAFNIGFRCAKETN